jgi:flagellar hook assembly protein FlgD
LTWKSSGNPRFGNGVPVFLRAISGHRDTGFTDCPGNALYAQLPAIAKAVASLGGPKIYAPLATKSGEGQVKFTARLSAAQPWTVTVVNSSGAQVAQGTGAGTAVDWTWDSSTSPPDRYTWTIASANARSASGSLGATAALAVQKASVSQASIAPGETATFGYTLTAPATVTITLVSPANQVLSTLLTASKPAGSQSLAFTPPSGLLNGQYALVVSAASGTRTATATIPFAVDDILTGFSAKGRSLSFTLNRAPVSIAYQVLRGADVVAVPTVPAAAAGPQTLAWDGILADGTRAPDGAYTLALTVTDEFATFTRTAPLVVDATPPRVNVLSYKNLRFRVSEPATLVLKVGTQTFRRTLKKPATTQFWLRTKPARYTLTATDTAGNATTVRYRR